MITEKNVSEKHLFCDWHFRFVSSQCYSMWIQQSRSVQCLGSPSEHTRDPYGKRVESLHIAPLTRKRQIDNFIKTRKQQKWSRFFFPVRVMSCPPQSKCVCDGARNKWVLPSIPWALKLNQTQTTTVLKSSPITAQEGSLHKTSFTFNNIGKVTIKIKEQWMSIVKKKMCWNKKMRHEKAKNKKRPKKK